MLYVAYSPEVVKDMELKPQFVHVTTIKGKQKEYKWKPKDILQASASEGKIKN
jgi:hypothetical protein